MGVTTENFNTAVLGTVNGYVGAIGTYSTAFGSNIQANDQYGGNAEGNYLGNASGSTATITLSSDVEYFGFYFMAGNAGNLIQLYDNGLLVFSLDTAELVTLLNNGVGTIQAINGAFYNTANYFGQPVSGSNSTEPYAYLHFIADSGSKFDEVRLTETGGSIFENDNHSIRDIAPEIPGTLVSVPEPSSALLGLLTFAAVCMRRRR